jgi:hypothetical protein
MAGRVIQSLAWSTGYLSVSNSFGQQVLVMAVENSDGSLTAENLIIGGEGQDWQMAFGPMQPRSAMPGEDGQTSPDFSEGEGSNFEELQK